MTEVPFVFVVMIATVVIVLVLSAILNRYAKAPKKKDNGREVHVRLIEGPSGEPLSNTPAGKLGKSILKGTCPDCNGKGFYEGPSGGISTNIYCRNQKCKSAFNFTYIFGEGHAERIGTAPNWFKYPGESDGR